MDAVRLITPVFLPVVLFMMMLALGLSLRVEDFRHTLKKPGLILMGVLAQMLLLPLIGCLVILVFDLQAEVAVAMMIVCLSPGGATSNMLSHLGGGDSALSVCLTLVSSLLTPVTLPLLTAGAIGYWLKQSTVVDFPLLKAMGQLLLISVVPILLGMVWNKRFPVSAKSSYRWLRRFSILGLFLIIIVMSVSHWSALQALLQQLWLACFVLFMLAFISGLGVARLSGGGSAEQVTLGFETGIQNAGTAIFVAAVLLQSPLMANVGLLYGVLMQVPALSIMLWLMLRYQQAGLPYSSSPQ